VAERQAAAAGEAFGGQQFEAQHAPILAGRRAATIDAVADMLSLSAHLPEIAFDAGAAVVREGGTEGALWVLVRGRLAVRKGRTLVNTVSEPGALIGEISALLGLPYGATVEAVEPSLLRHAVDGRALLASHPDITRLVAIGLAERLNFVTTYLADLKQQYGDAPGLAMASDVLNQLARRSGPPARPGSARDPDPDY
jgi:CRP-like cAMP-binding protein